jgi:hypothetical protein
MNPSTEQSLREELQLLRDRLGQLERRRKQRTLGLVAALILVSGTAGAQLITFSPVAPALASEVNQNFTQLRTWIEQKVGPVGSSVVTFSTPLAGAQLENLTVTGGKLADGAITSAKIVDGGVTSANIADGTIVNADLGPDVGCPTSAREALGQCIFVRPTNGAYMYNYRAAAAACLVDRARLCTAAELSAAHAAGMNVCGFGWLADRSTDTAGYVGYPFQTTIPGACNAGINLQNRPMTDAVAAWCCK